MEEKTERRHLDYLIVNHKPSIFKLRAVWYSVDSSIKMKFSCHSSTPHAPLRPNLLLRMAFE